MPRQRQTKKERIYSMIEAGVPDTAIRRRERINKRTLAAYKAHVSRNGELPNNTVEREAPNPRAKDLVIQILNEGATMEDLYTDRRLQRTGVSEASIRAYAAHWTRGSYDE